MYAASVPPDTVANPFVKIACNSDLVISSSKGLTTGTVSAFKYNYGDNVTFH